MESNADLYFGRHWFGTGLIGDRVYYCSVVC
jgi:hypothetical protein